MTEHLQPQPEEVFLHFKGHLIKVIGIYKDSEVPSKLRITYKHLDTGEEWVRPAEMWFQKVRWPDGIERPRFIRYTKDVPKPIVRPGWRRILKRLFG